MKEEVKNTAQDHHPARYICGGTLMGLANLVPGISGGTMLVAAGVYDTFIEAISNITRFKFKSAVKPMLFIAIPAMVTILVLASLISYLMVHQRTYMYSLFIGLTLGGVPILIKLIRKSDRVKWTTYVSAAVGIAAMAGLAYLETATGGSGKENGGFFLFLLAGIAGASAMILPGVSGGYLLLLLGAYLPIINSIRDIFQALKAFDINALLTPIINIALPVGLGVVLGVVTVSNLIKYLFKKYKQVTLGFLTGLLIGSLISLWPFQQPKKLHEGDIIKNQKITLIDEVWHYEISGKEVKHKDIPYLNRLPNNGIEVVGAITMILLGLGASQIASRFDKPEKS